MQAENRTLLEMTVRIVSAFVERNPVGVPDLSKVITHVYDKLASSGETTVLVETIKAKPAVSIKASVKSDHLVCLEDGRHFKQLKRHLRVDHQLSTDDYRAKWNLPKSYPMVAPGYTEIRRAMALSNGLGRRRFGSGMTDEAAGMSVQSPVETVIETLLTMAVPEIAVQAAPVLAQTRVRPPRKQVVAAVEVDKAAVTVPAAPVLAKTGGRVPRKQAVAVVEPDKSAIIVPATPVLMKTRGRPVAKQAGVTVEADQPAVTVPATPVLMKTRGRPVAKQAGAPVGADRPAVFVADSNRAAVVTAAETDDRVVVLAPAESVEPTTMRTGRRSVDFSALVKLPRVAAKVAAKAPAKARRKRSA